MLYFDYSGDTNNLQVFAKRPIIIENAALGYLIRMDLEEFIYSFKTDDVVFKYSIFLEDMLVSKAKLAQIADRRKLLYAGSTMHFIVYYNKILLQDKVISFDTIKVKSSVFTKPNKDWTLVNFNSKDTLMVRYRGEDPSKVKAVTFSMEISMKSPPVKMPEKPLKHALVWNSYVFFFNEEGINIESNGHYAELGAFFYGDMGDRRVAGMLPFDYDENKKL